MTTLETLKLLAEIDKMLEDPDTYDPTGYNSDWKYALVDDILSGKSSESQISYAIKRLHQNLIDQANGVFDDPDYAENL